MITSTKLYARDIREASQPLMHGLTVVMSLPALDEPERGGLVTSTVVLAMASISGGRGRTRSGR